MIHEQICTFEVAKLAREKGFNVQTFDWYDYTGNYQKGFIPHKLHECPRYREYYAPTQSLLQRWLREEKGVTICVDIFDDGWFFDISTFYKQDIGIYEVDIPYKSSNVSPVYDTYELALEDALKYTLENLV